MLVGLFSETYYTGRMAIFTNTISLDLFFIRMNFTPWWVSLYLIFGTILGVIGFIYYIDNQSLSQDFYDVALLYHSAVAALIMVAGNILIPR